MLSECEWDWSFLDAVVEGVYMVTGDGRVDFVSVFRELPGNSGRAVAAAEQDPDKAPPARCARMGHDNLVRHLEEAGLTA